MRAYVSGVMSGGACFVASGGGFCSSSTTEGEENTGYDSPNSAKYQSGMSVEDNSPADMTGLRVTAAENISGYCPITSLCHVLILH